MAINEFLFSLVQSLSGTISDRDNLRPGQSPTQTGHPRRPPNVNVLTYSTRLHPRGGVDSVAKEAVTWHPYSDHPSDNRTCVTHGRQSVGDGGSRGALFDRFSPLITVVFG